MIHSLILCVGLKINEITEKKEITNEKQYAKDIQAHLGPNAGSVSDHRNKASITIKPVVVFLLVEGFASNV